MARKRKQIDILVENAKILQRIHNASAKKDLISEMFKRPEEPFHTKKRKIHRRHKNKKKILL